MKIHLVVDADTLPLQSERCWRLGLIVHELVTNSVRHASFDHGNGEIKIQLTRTGELVNCGVSDIGSGSARVKLGCGLKIVDDLVNSLGGRFGHHFGPDSTSFALAFPLTERELRANRASGNVAVNRGGNVYAGAYNGGGYGHYGRGGGYGYYGRGYWGSYAAGVATGAAAASGYSRSYAYADWWLLLHLHLQETCLQARSGLSRILSYRVSVH